MVIMTVERAADRGTVRGQNEQINDTHNVRRDIVNLLDTTTPTQPIKNK